MIGEDSLTMNEELTRWKKAFSEKFTDMNLEDFQVDKGPSLRISETQKSSGSSSRRNSITTLLSPILQTAPFLAPKRLVIIRDLLMYLKADDREDFGAQIEKLPDSTVLVLAESKSLDKRQSLTKKLQKIATLKTYPKPEGAGLTHWVMQRAQSKNMNLGNAAANALVAATGDQLWALNQELEKLSLYSEALGESEQKNSSPAPITAKMISELCSQSTNESIFTFTDQLGQKRMREAFQTLKNLQEQGEEAPYLFAMIVRQFRLILDIKSHLNEGASEGQIAKSIKAHPYVVKTVARQARSFSTETLKTLLKGLHKIDRRLKTGKLHLRTDNPNAYLLAIEELLLKTQ